ncbi:hypothetical protein GCM10010470_33970 [Saccharopolyspora taberi]|uniref:GGDEF domain-containing protein n=1 Tax=Saccharopolyspora taberi TaxID=60895 RepID=A0ABN3VE31_9PSEU
MVAFALLAVEIGVVASGVLGSSGSIALNKTWEVLFSVVALVTWIRSAARHRGPDGRWRWWMSAAMACFVIGLVAWAVGQTFTEVPPPTATLSAAGFLLTPVLALLALVVHAYGREPGPPSPLGRPSNRAVQALDLVIIAGSVLMFVSVTLGERLSRSWGGSGPVLTVLLAHPLAYLLLVAGTVVLARLRSSARDLPVVFVVFGAVAYMVSSTAFGHYVDLREANFPPVLEAGFTACPVLFLLAALAPGTSEPERDLDPRLRPTARDLVQLAVPYLPLIATTLFVGVGLLAGITLTWWQDLLFVALMALIILRQLVTLLDNNRLLRRAEHEALHDPLTGLANRTLFLHWLERSLADRREPLVLAFCDLDDFKEVNDNFGHAIGDLVLTGTARRLERSLSGDGLVARLGGDEFAVVLHDVREPIEDVGQRLLAALREPHPVNGRPLSVGASVGITSLTPDEPVDCTDTLLRWADSAMYTAKRRGKNTLAHALEPQEERSR